MPTLSGSLASTGPNSFSAKFKFLWVTYPGEGTQTPGVPSWSVPDASLTFNLPEMGSTVTVPFSGTIGPTNIDVHSTVANAKVNGRLATPLDKQYDVTGSLTFSVILELPESTKA